MRILAALGLPIWIAFSSVAFAENELPQNEWTTELTGAKFERPANHIGLWNLSSTSSGGCFGIVFVGDGPGPQNANGVDATYLFALDNEGRFLWKSRRFVGPDYSVRIRLSEEKHLMYNANGSLYSVCWDENGLAQERLVETAPGDDRFESSGNKVGSDSDFFTYSNMTNSNVALRRSVSIKKWSLPRQNTVRTTTPYVGVDDGNLIISWPTAAGQTYQVQRSTDLQSWENIGVALTGNGTTMSYSQPSNADKVFLRVVIP